MLVSDWLQGSLAQPQMLVVSDIQDVFVPLLEGFFVKLSESEALIDRSVKLSECEALIDRSVKLSESEALIDRSVKLSEHRRSGRMVDLQIEKRKSNEMYC